jgi:hypothetical protein
VVISALKTGINIPEIVYIIYLGRLYKLTSFIQQARHKGQAKEISNSIVILLSSGSDSDSGQFLAP